MDSLDDRDGITQTGKSLLTGWLAKCWTERPRCVCVSSEMRARTYPHPWHQMEPNLQTRPLLATPLFASMSKTPLNVAKQLLCYGSLGTTSIPKANASHHGFNLVFPQQTPPPPKHPSDRRTAGWRASILLKPRNKVTQNSPDAVLTP